MQPRRGKSYGYKKPTLAARRARAITFIINARSLDGITDEQLAHRFELPLKVIADLRARAAL